MSSDILLESGGFLLLENGDNILLEVQEPETQAFRSSGHGTQWAYKTLSQIEREKKAELARICKQAKRLIVKVIAEGLLDPIKLDDVVEAKVEAVDTTVVTKSDVDQIIARLKAEARRTLIRKQQEEDEDDYEVLLLAA